MKQRIKTILAALLTALMLATAAVPAFAVEAKAVPGTVNAAANAGYVNVTTEYIALNALRREALDRLDEARMNAMPNPADGYTPVSPKALVSDMGVATAAHREPAESPLRTARFYTSAQITPAAAEYFTLLYLPLGREHPAFVPTDRRGAILPPVIFDREAPAAEETLAEALTSGVRHLLVGNIGHLPLVRRAAERAGIPWGSVILHGDFRLNVTNTLSALRRTEAQSLFAAACTRRSSVGCAVGSFADIYPSASFIGI